MDTLVTYMFQITVAFMIIQVCIPIVIIVRSRHQNKAKYSGLTQLEVEEMEHQHFLQEVDAILNMNHISHCED
ncbi:hypothetical protein [Mucilaginibacter sp. SG564]|uniref:hypothetical protein n=1 Tax=unclassified Mucilaginibacter TaxID=2617802 RepID=UPI001553A0F6|nr:hypothetical protein [Mucilaginibacter sp. SG564]NOW95800.1 hypothetical protein [Mucilaginibacter sp. SG564]